MAVTALACIASAYEYIFSASSSIMPPVRNPRRTRRMVVAYIAARVLVSVQNAIGTYKRVYYNKTPYHTSALSGAAWLEELRTGHDERIKTELGVSKDVFSSLIAVLRELGHADSRFISLEEQVAIFLHMCVVGTSVRHIGERFQRSNDTIAKCVIYQILLVVF